MTTQQMLDERYGRTRSPARRWIVAAGIAVAVTLVALFGWMTVSGSLDAVDSDATGFEVVDAHSVVLSFQITAPPGRSVACAIEAQDQEHGVVGWRVHGRHHPISLWRPAPRCGRFPAPPRRSAQHGANNAPGLLLFTLYCKVFAKSLSVRAQPAERAASAGASARRKGRIAMADSGSRWRPVYAL